MRRVERTTTSDAEIVSSRWHIHWFVVMWVTILSSATNAFGSFVISSRTTRSSSNSATTMKMALDPHDIVHTISSTLQQHHHHGQHHDAAATTDSFSALLSMLHSKHVSLSAQTTQMLAQDKHSIPPPNSLNTKIPDVLDPKSFQKEKVAELPYAQLKQLVQSTFNRGGIDALDKLPQLNVNPTQNLVPSANNPPSDEGLKALKQAQDLGIETLDYRTINKYVTHSPGFKETKSLLPLPAENPVYTKETYENQAASATRSMNVFSKIPLAAFVTAGVDLLLVQPLFEVYQEENDDKDYNYDDDYDENEDTIIVEGTQINLIRVAVVIVVAALTIAFAG